jgi:hypothetical protein
MIKKSNLFVVVVVVAVAVAVYVPPHFEIQWGKKSKS